jgi:hypothetical protein
MCHIRRTSAVVSGQPRSNSMTLMSWPPLALAAGTHPANMPDKDEVPGSSPARPTTPGVDLENARRASLGFGQDWIIRLGMRCTGV